jgi:3',5'-cyclic AMP phosphodiesterase CpdA
MTARDFLARIIVSVCFLLPGAGAGPADEQPAFRFGLVADVQYGDKPARGKRAYRDASVKLRAAVVGLAQHDLAFVVNLGDIIDGNGVKSGGELALIAGIFREMRAPVYHIIGNHCLSAGRTVVMRELGLRSPYYEFVRERWRFLLLDGMDVSVKSAPGSEEARQAREFLAKNPKLPKYNGAIGRRQMAWLQERLQAAGAAGERVIVFCHHPITAEKNARSLLLWNAGEVEGVLAKSGRVAAWINGHDHKGGYVFTNGIHHLTVPGMVESPPGGNSYAIAEVFGDRIAIVGQGTVPSRVLRLRN